MMEAIGDSPVPNVVAAPTAPTERKYQPMKALAVTPGVPKSARLVDVPPPDPGTGVLLVRGRAVGICGTDIEIIEGGYGEAPPGQDHLILGHESLGEVIEAAPGSGFTPGDLVVGVVRRPDPEPCDHCAIGQWDMCRNGRYSECGIKQRDGYACEEYRLDPEYAVRVDPALGEFGVLLEPASVVAKACVHGMHILRRTEAPIRTALITGAGPIGLLAALVTRQAGLETYVVDVVKTGPKPDLVRALGARYHAGSALDLDISPDVVIECTGIGSVLREAGGIAAPGAVIALTGISAAPSALEVDLNAFNKHMVLNNKVLFGSVNAARGHYEAAAKVLAQADPEWLRGLISRKVPAQRWQEVLERRPDDVKVVLVMDAG
jgi:threonine dehydrogenase-like Zn-dependent dehydrogenase